MTQVTQEKETAMTFNFTARAELSDYGVERSPKWVEIVDEEFESVDIGDYSYSYSELVSWFGQHGADAIVQIGRDMLQGEDWG